ncbi:DUF4129 domain-containing protein [Mycobacterium shinjukuense]|uniref:Uncharacterized protein n=1 Tax=Mycobacterium shinjukuense TaxID=398694 RepID=A0A7I7MQH8_9MYCO|nr:DUF4129 domain-containing protein [Mycobacterium shinjukuense]MCV6985407.1 DUF4129 domain-containing protein [Mycobacterium shinjukuense]ORB66445.1 hypothetical protein BST45_13815 [Mycobacterium shinjukuense]BBX74495.1 hypothetical protein MSHI_24010 [Mycobacterium shinjukuense]
MSGKPTGRVVVLIALLIVSGAALRGYLPAHDGARLAEAGGSRAALIFLVAALAGTLALMAFAIVSRLRDPRAVAPSAGTLSDLLGRGTARPSWRVLLIGLGMVLGWLLIAMLLSGLFTPYEFSPDAPTPDSSPPPTVGEPTPPPGQVPKNDNGAVLAILLASTIPLLLMVIAGAVIAARRRRGVAAGVLTDDDTAARRTRSETLARAAEVGLAEMADPSRGPRAAIIACYAAMECELAKVPDVVPQEFDTPTEVLARAVEHRVLHADNAVQLVNLFAEARFSPHVMNEGHREVAVRLLHLVLDDLRTRSHA